LAHGVTHGFPEWKQRFQQGTSSTISIEDILRGVGRDRDQADIVRELEAEIQADQLFGGPLRL